MGYVNRAFKIIRDHTVSIRCNPIHTQTMMNSQSREKKFFFWLIRSAWDQSCGAVEIVPAFMQLYKIQNDCYVIVYRKRKRFVNKVTSILIIDFCCYVKKKKIPSAEGSEGDLSSWMICLYLPSSLSSSFL